MKPLVFFSLLLVPPSLFAQTPRIADEIIVTASELPETVESTPAAVTVITRKQIEDQAARDVADVLRQVPGLSVSRTGSLGKVASVFIRGASSKQTLVLWNGVEINDPYFSGYNWGQFSTAGVRRIEVVRGPFSSLYGADAVGGVVNIITAGGSDRADLDIAAGGRGLFNGVASLDKTAGTTSLSVVAEHRQDEGFAPNDNERRNSLLGGVSFAPERGLQIGLTGRAANYDLGVPRNSNDLGTAYVATPHHREHGSAWQLALPITAELRGVHAELRLSQSDADDRNEDPDAQTFGRTTSSRRDLHLSGRGATAVGTIVAGLEAERSDARNRDSFGLNIEPRHRSSRALFLEDRFSRGALEISAGARYDHYDTFGSEISPRLAVAWMRAGNKIRGAYGQSFRAPQIGELYLPFFGNPELQPERSRTGEIGYDRFFDGDGVASVTLFRSTFRHLIVYDLSANRFGNIGEARSSGLELSASDRFGAWSAALSYTYLRAVEEPTGAQLVRRPRHSGSLALGYRRGMTTAEFVVERVGSRPDVNDLFPFGTVTNGAYTVADVALHWNAGAFAPYVKIENLTNARYQEVFGFPSPSRRAIVGIRYSALH